MLQDSGPRFPSSQEDRGLASNPESQAFVCLHQIREIQDGDFELCSEVSVPGLLGLLNRSQGRLSAYIHSRGSSQVAEVHSVGQAYAFRCLPFGLSTAPRVFTRIVKSIGAALRRRGVIIFLYLDDWLFLAPTRELVIQHTALALQYLKVRGFIVNMGRSHLIPTQFPIFLDASFDFIRSLVRPSVQRVYNLLACIALMIQVQSAPALAWLNFWAGSRGQLDRAGPLLQTQNETYSTTVSSPFQAKQSSDVKAGSGVSGCDKRATGAVT